MLGGLAQIGDGSVRVRLPGGLVDQRGRRHVEAELRPLTGAAERALREELREGSVAMLTTAVLAHAIHRIGTLDEVTPGLVRSLLIQDRDHLLARLGSLMLRRPLWARLPCPSCSEEMELPLELDALPVTERAIEARYFTFDDELEFRLPTGADQEWAAAAGLAGPELVGRLLVRCVRWRRRRRGRPPIGDRAAALEERMRDLAPDVTPEVEAACPQCQTAFATTLDVPFLVLSELVGGGGRLDEEVHILAWNYHWAEGEILALSRPRRERYVRLIREQLETGAAV